MVILSPWRVVVLFVVLLTGTALPVQALPVSVPGPPLAVRERENEVAAPLLLGFYRQLPHHPLGEASPSEAPHDGKSLDQFRRQVSGHYTEGTLQRLAACSDVETRRAAVLALRMIGTMTSNEALAGRLDDGDAQVRTLALDALWAMWFRAGGAANEKELRHALDTTDATSGIDLLTALIRKAPGYAEAYNQRGILYFKTGQYDRCAADCERALRLNRFHYAAAAGLGRCYLRLRLPAPALKAFRQANTINPHLDGVQEAIRELEAIVDEEHE